MTIRWETMSNGDERSRAMRAAMTAIQSHEDVIHGDNEGSFYTMVESETRLNSVEDWWSLKYSVRYLLLISSKTVARNGSREIGL